MVAANQKSPNLWIIFYIKKDGKKDIFNQLGKGTSYGNSTTHLSKLIPKIEGGGGAGCPLLVFGIKPTLLTGDC